MSLAFGTLETAHLPARHRFDFPYALAVLSRQRDGSVYAWTAGDSPDSLNRSFKWMSVTKFLVAIGFWVQKRGSNASAVPLDFWAPAGGFLPDSVRVVDLLAHCAGLPFDAPRESASAPAGLGVKFGVAPLNQCSIPPFTKRIYSNYSFEVATQIACEKLGMSWTDWIAAALLKPLGMNGTKLAESPAWGAVSPISDLARLAAAVLSPEQLGLTDAEVARNTAAVHPGLRGVLPGYGHQRDNLWAAGVELHGNKSPHYLPEDFPPDVIGHFGQSGSFIWVDRAAGAAGVFLGEKPFGLEHKEIWPSLNAQIRQLALLAN